jgi:hypothetical protein
MGGRRGNFSSFWFDDVNSTPPIQLRRDTWRYHPAILRKLHGEDSDLTAEISNFASLSHRIHPDLTYTHNSVEI